jgi:hypothetical protein
VEEYVNLAHSRSCKAKIANDLINHTLRGDSACHVEGIECRLVYSIPKATMCDMQVGPTGVRGFAIFTDPASQPRSHLERLPSEVLELRGLRILAAACLPPKFSQIQDLPLFELQQTVFAQA